ncbi:MAG: complex I NDUFA9 subunit family protein, partial [Pseudomonadota bacterium]
VYPTEADIRDTHSVDRALEGAVAAVNAVGLYVERGRETFRAVHVEGAHTLAVMAARRGIERLVHISGIGAERNSKSAYVRARADGEAAVLDALPEATILRPSVMFGPDDNFLNLFIRMARLLPAIPLFGNGETKLQPVYVDDVARAVAQSLEAPDTAGRIYELGGPFIYNYRQILELVMAHAGHSRRLVPWPFALWELQAWCAQILPRPPISRDQVELMRHDNVVMPGMSTLADIGIRPTALEEILPLYPGQDNESSPEAD